MITVRALAGRHEYADAVQLQRMVWGWEDLDILPVRFFVVALLRLDHVGGDVARAGNWNDRIVEKSDAGKMRVESSGDGDSIVASRACLLTNAEIDDNVFDHSGRSSSRSSNEFYRY